MGYADVIYPEGFTVRQMDMLIFGHHHWPMKDQGEPEFWDTLHSLPRSIHWPENMCNPWSQLCPTIVSRSTIAIRYVPDGSSQPIVRALTGKEIMALVGLGPAYWRPDTPNSFAW